MSTVTENEETSSKVFGATYSDEKICCCICTTCDFRSFAIYGMFGITLLSAF